LVGFGRVRQEKPARSLQYERRLPCKLII
jgi:hypothetical protein